MKTRKGHIMHRKASHITVAVAAFVVALVLVVPIAGFGIQGGLAQPAQSAQTAVSEGASAVASEGAGEAGGAAAGASEWSTAEGSEGTDGAGDADGTDGANAVVAGQDDTFDPSIDDPDAFGAPYQSNVVLVNLKDGLDPEQAVAQLARETGLEGLSVASTAGDYVKLALPQGQSVADAIDALQQSDVVASAQPNFRYFVMENDGTTSTAHAASAAGSTSVASEPGAASTASTASAASAAGSTSAASTSGAASAANAASSATGALAMSSATNTAGGLQAGSLVTQGWTINDTWKSKQWALESLKAYDAWEDTRGDAPQTGQSRVTVAIVDDCFNVNHEDLKNNIAVSYNAVEGVRNYNMKGSSSHGTHVAGIVAAQANNGTGVAGVSHNARLMPIRVSTSSGSISSESLVKAYEFILANASTYNVRVVNMSLGAPMITSEGELADKWDSTGDDAVLDMIDAAWAKGIVTVTSAGNAGEYYLSDGYEFVDAPFLCWPGDYDRCVNVVALKKTESGGLARYSSSNYNLPGMYTKDIAAPGASIYSTYSSTNSSYGTLSGTSMASPYVAGVLALVFTSNPALTSEQAVSRLYDTASDLGDAGWDRVYGYGIANAAKASAVPAPKSTQYKAVYTAVSQGTKSSITSAKLASASYAYTGKTITPGVSVYCGKAKLTKGTDYTVKYSSSKRTALGSYTVTITGKGNYKGTKTLTFKIVKAKNTLTVKGKTIKAKSTKTLSGKYALTGKKTKKLKGKLVFARAKGLTVSKARGTVTYSKVSGSKYLSIAKSTGKITVKKGTPRGTFSMKVKVSAAGTKCYKPLTKTVTVKVTVK